jgi:hypothetical protein
MNHFWQLITKFQSKVITLSYYLDNTSGTRLHTPVRCPWFQRLTKAARAHIPN